VFKAEFVFVYGTLRPPKHNSQPEDSRYYSTVANCIDEAVPARLFGADIFDLGTFPGVVQGNGVVNGDLLTVTAPVLAIMDRIEGHPKFFKREKASVQTEKGSVQAWVYWAPPNLIVGRSVISGGDWLTRDVNIISSLSESASTVAGLSPIDDTLRNLVRQFARAECSWLSTVRPDGRAHSVPVWHVWHQGRAYIITSGNSVKVSNLKQNPSVAIAYQDPLNPIIIEGWGTIGNRQRDRLQPIFAEKYGLDIRNGSEYDTVIEITPLKLLAWGKYGSGRWSGDDVIRVWSVGDIMS
jgi:gamma-glutamylcyclotransferase (GGCT)/AIG2-like uncharacterized protein YtfP